MFLKLFYLSPTLGLNKLECFSLARFLPASLIFVSMTRGLYYKKYGSVMYSKCTEFIVSECLLLLITITSTSTNTLAYYGIRTLGIVMFLTDKPHESAL
jgi:hypothetical protein